MLTYEQRQAIRDQREAGLVRPCTQCVGSGQKPPGEVGECQTCDGTGADYRAELRWVNCELCGGSGEVEARPIVGPYEDPTPCAELCSACGGTGRDCVEVSPVECDDDQPRN